MATEINQVTPVDINGGGGGSGGVVGPTFNQSLTIKDGGLQSDSGVQDVFAIVAAHPELAMLIIVLVAGSIYFINKGRK